jgi:enoyl-CoA hydratase/carnithine racemase
MGGGVGISIYGKYRIATERTVWAMPETGIGLFPDVGSLYWMPRLLPMDLALYLALTGRKLGPSDLLSTGLATHYVPSEDLPALEAALVEATLKKKDEDETLKETDPIAPLLMSFHREATPPQESALTQDRSEISNSFGVALKKPGCTVADVLASLPDNDFGRLTSDTLAKMSPTSCALTLEGLKRGAASATLAEDFVNEFRLSQACLRPLPDGSMPDFFEGIRAALVDKDNKPQWQPAIADVNTYFEPVKNEWKVSSNASKL